MVWTAHLKESVIEDLRWFGKKDGRMLLKEAEQRLLADPAVFDVQWNADKKHVLFGHKLFYILQLFVRRDTSGEKVVMNHGSCHIIRRLDKGSVHRPHCCNSADRVDLKGRCQTVSSHRFGRRPKNIEKRLDRFRTTK